MMKRDTGDVDGTGWGKIDTFDRSTWPESDNIARRDAVADHVGLFLVEAVGLEDFVNLVYVRLIGGEEA